jgi:hypothetical protein
MKFETWLTKQANRDDPIGDLANDYLKARKYLREPYSDRFIDSNVNSFDILEQMLAWKACFRAYESLFEALAEFENKPYHIAAPMDTFKYHFGLRNN